MILRSGWDRLWRWLRSRFRGARAAQSTPALEAQRTALLKVAHELSKMNWQLSQIQAQLHGRAESLKRLMQRYDDQARKHYKLNQRRLAEAAIREGSKHQVELEHLEARVQAVERRMQALKACQEQLTESISQGLAAKGCKESVALLDELQGVAVEIRELQTALQSDGPLEVRERR